MAESRPPYAPEYRRPHWSVVGLAPYRGVARHGDIAGCRGDACVAPTAWFRAGLELSFCGADSWAEPGRVPLRPRLQFPEEPGSPPGVNIGTGKGVTLPWPFASSVETILFTPCLST